MPSISASPDLRLRLIVRNRLVEPVSWEYRNETEAVDVSTSFDSFARMPGLRDIQITAELPSIPAGLDIGDYVNWEISTGRGSVWRGNAEVVDWEINSYKDGLDVTLQVTP